jgi:glycosyltransferase involved in cell wall biosynthesis
VRQQERPRVKPIRVLFFYDVEGWAWWNKIRHIRRHLPARFSVDMQRIGTPFDHERYDFIVIFEHFFLRQMTGVPRAKIVMGSCCPRTLDGLLTALPGSGVAAAILNNLPGYRAVENVYRSYYCPNGVDAALFAPAPRPVEDFSVCWVGNAASMGNKGLDLIVAACDRAGVPLCALDQQQKIAQGTVMGQEALRDTLYHRAAAYVCASEMEGTPNPCLEAMACGLPVVTTRVGNMPEVVRDGMNGLFVERSVEDLTAALGRLRDMDWRAMGRSARAGILEGWTWAHMAARYERMFCDLADGRAEVPEAPDALTRSA